MKLLLVSARRRGPERKRERERERERERGRERENERLDFFRRKGRASAIRDSAGISREIPRRAETDAEFCAPGRDSIFEQSPAKFMRDKSRLARRS